ncbi:MAG: M1 family aminopeptidase [Paraglaciecola sp.]|uniref:M1 family aminopeptidase n=1 Tax=Paraglaciecola sp. TaxID=1920173 RepID=UPI003297D8F9
MLKLQLGSELQLQWRQPVFLILLLVAPLFGYFVGQGINSSQAELFQRFHLQQVVGSLSMMALPWLSVILAVSALFRDQHSNMCELVGALPLSQKKRQGLIVSVLLISIYVICIVAVCGVFVGVCVQAQTMPAPLTLFHVFFQLQGLLIMLALPALLFFLALFWLLRNVSAPPMILYLTGLLIFVSYMAMASASGSPLMAGSQVPDPIFKMFWSYLDWFGLTVLFTKDIEWEVFFLNRVVVLLAAVLAVSLALRWSTFNVWGSKKNTQSSASLGKSKALDVGPFKFFGCTPKPNSQFFALLRLQSSQLLLHPGALFMGLVWGVIIFAETYPSLHVAEMGASLQGVTMDAVNRFMWDLVPLFGSMLILFVGYSLTWRDQHYNFALVTETFPVSFVLVFFSRLVLLVVVLLIFLLVTCVASLVCQLMGDSAIQLSEYGRFVVYSGVPLAAKGVAFLALLSLVKQRVIALSFCVFILVLEFTPLPSLLGLLHPLFKPFATPLQEIDSILGYKPYVEGFWDFSLFWLLVSAALVFVSLMLNKARKWPLQIPKYGVALSIVLGLALFQISHLNHEIVKDGNQLSVVEQLQLLANYENSYSQFGDELVPNIDKVTTRVDLYPMQRKAEINGSYYLSNPHKKPIKQILVSEDWRSPVEYIQLEHESQVIYDAVQGQRIFQLESPLAPGQKTKLTFKLVLQQSGYQAIKSHKILTSEFIYLRAIPFFPALGYQGVREISNNDLRIEYGLSPRNKQTTEEKLEVRDRAKDRYQWSLLSTIISVPKGYQSFSQGELVAQWEQQDRVYRRYETESAVHRVQAFIATPAETETRLVSRLLLQVAYYPQHKENVTMTLDAMQQTVEFLSRFLGPFPGNTLTLIESPDAGPTGFALPQLILIGSKLGFRSRADAEYLFSHTYRRAVHETAHQWFGHLLGNGIQQDSAFLVESMAKYVELVLLEKHYGTEAMQALVDYETQRFLHAENHNREAPVSLVNAQSPHDKYSRATVVFSRLRAQLGDEPILAALSEIIELHRYPLHPASSVDFVNALIKQVPERRAFIEELLIQQVSVSDWLTQP